jgi:hypothetical protein
MRSISPNNKSLLNDKPAKKTFLGSVGIRAKTTKAIIVSIADNT